MLNGHAQPGTQPSPGSAEWTIDKLEVMEPAGATHPDNIIEQGRPFSLKVTFKGSGPGFIAYTNLKAPYRVRMSIEGMGGAKEIDLPEISGNLVPGQVSYEVEVPVPSSLITDFDADSVYQVGCVVTFNPTIPGMSGFIEHVPFHIYVAQPV